MEMSYVFYMAECEGLIPTRRGRINAAIKDIKAYPAPSIPLDAFVEILHNHDLSYDELTPKELNYIESKL